MYYGTGFGDAEAVEMSSELITPNDMDSMTPSEYDSRQIEQSLVFERLEARVDKLLENYGRPDYQPGQRHGDYHVHDDYSEYPQVVVFVNSLKLILPSVVGALQEIAKEFPGWQIDLMVTLRGHEDWPNMGISIRDNEIVDDLQRQYFPPEYRDLAYEHSRRGSVWDRWQG